MTQHQNSKSSNHIQHGSATHSGQQHASAPDHNSNNSNSGNFKNNPAKASEAGKKGGQHSHDSTKK